MVAIVSDQQPNSYFYIMRIFLSSISLCLLFFAVSCGNSDYQYLATVKLDGKYGYISEKGDLIIDAQFEDAWSFIRGTAVVKKEGKFGLINKEGAFVGNSNYDSIVPFSANCCAVYKDSLFGFMEYGTGKILIPPRYENIYAYAENLCVVQRGRALGIVNDFGVEVCPVIMQDFKSMLGPAAICIQHDTSDEMMLQLSLIMGAAGGKMGLISENGKILTQPKYDDIFDDLPNGFYYPFFRSPDAPEDTVFIDGPEPIPPGTYGIIDTSGKIISEPLFEEIPVYGDGMFRVKKNGLYGYINLRGEMIVQPQYDFAVAFSEGKAIVSIESNVSIIDRTGKILAANLGSGSGMYRFFSGLARCRSADGRYGFLDASGNRVIKPEFDVADDFDHGRAVVEMQNFYGLIDTKGDYIIQPQYEFIYHLGDGYYQVKDANENAAVFDSTGKEVLPFRFNEIFHLQKNWFTVEQNGLNGCYSLDGKEIYPAHSFLQVYFFDNRCLVTNEEGYYGMIDGAGKEILPTRYDSIGVYFKGYATIQEKNKYGLADSTGKICVEPQFEELRPMVNGFSVFRRGSKYGYVDANGAIVIEAKYEDASVFINPDRTRFE
jgi:WG containing repeat